MSEHAYLNSKKTVTLPEYISLLTLWYSVCVYLRNGCPAKEKVTQLAVNSVMNHIVPTRLLPSWYSAILFYTG